MVVFEEKGNRSTQRTSWCRVENQQTQPTFDAGSGNRTRVTLVGGECSHHRAIPASLKVLGWRVLIILCPMVLPMWQKVLLLFPLN